MASPGLMTITTGFNKSCRVWVDKSILKALPDMDVPKMGFEYCYEN